jgi:acetyltransferase-like isoleucine patch superfamily enzyme
MILSYLKFIIKDNLKQCYRKFKVRRHNYVGRNCFISKDLIMEEGSNIHDYVYILQNVKLKKNVSIGLRAVLSNIEVGENSFVDSGVICTGFGDGKIIIGENTYIGINNVLDWSSDLTIGNFVHIAGPSTGLWTHSSVNMISNSIELKNISSKERYRLPVKIEDNVYIGGGCIIYPGVTIHHHSVIAPNSTVIKDVESYTMVGGSPAKFIKNVE